MGSQELNLLDILRDDHVGMAKCINGYKLAELMNSRGIDIRKYINSLRSAGYPICSMKTGYFYAETTEEIRHTIDGMRARLVSMSKAVNGLSEYELKGEQ